MCVPATAAVSPAAVQFSLGAWFDWVEFDGDEGARIRVGKLSSVTLLRRLRHDSRKNKLYRAFREFGRVIRTIVLLRYTADMPLDGVARRASRW